MSHPISDAIETLSRRVGHAWQATGLHQDRFAEIAADALREAELSALHDPVELVKWLLATPLPPAEPGENDFAAPAITVYRDERFRVEILLWSGGMPPTEHDHVSPGAFAVLDGERIHFPYAFEEVNHDRAGWRRGALRHRGPELLRRGDVRAIPGLDGLIHSLFFLDTLGTTLAIRARQVDGPSYLYFEPGLAVDSSLLNLDVVKRLRAVQSLRRAGPHGSESVAQLAPSMSPLVCLFSLMESRPVGASVTQADEALRALMPDRTGADALLGAVLAARRRGAMEAVIATAKDPALRLLLGLLWAPAPRDRALALLHERRGGRAPAATARSLLDALHEQAGSVFGVPWEDPVPEIYELLLAGHRAPAIPDLLGQSYDPESVEALRPEVGRISAALLEHPVLGCWLT
jgi:hypothetical protein